MSDDAQRKSGQHRIDLLRAEHAGLSMYSADPDKWKRMALIAKKIRRIWAAVHRHTNTGPIYFNRT